MLFRLSSASTVLVALVAVTAIHHCGGRSTMLETNEIDFTQEEVAEDLPVCLHNSVCGYLQANAWGINKQPMCRCPAGRCPMVWDSRDGQSVTQGSDQYKFCGNAPSLKVCQPMMIAYTTTFYFNLADDSMALEDKLHCICPANHNYQQIRTKTELVDTDTEAFVTKYLCSPLLSCGPTDPCKVITDTPTTFLVNAKCHCPPEQSCPSLSAHRETTRPPFGNGLVHMIKCE